MTRAELYRRGHTFLRLGALAGSLGAILVIDALAGIERPIPRSTPAPIADPAPCGPPAARLGPR